MMIKKKEFSLIELLIVISIIAILASILLPALNKAKDTARTIHCANNLKQLGVSLFVYTSDYNSSTPPSYAPNTLNGVSRDYTWHGVLMEHLGIDNKMKTTSIFICPSASIPVTPEANREDGVYTYSGNEIIFGDRPSIGLIPPIPLRKITRASDVLLVSDGTQLSNYNGRSVSTLWRYPFSRNDQPNWNLNEAANPSTQLNQDGPDEATYSGYIRYRHKKRANSLMVDGHVEDIMFGQLTFGNAFPTR